MRQADRISLAAVAAAVLAGLPLTALNQDRTFLALGSMLALASFGIGAGLRRSWHNEFLVRLAQLLPVLLIPLLIAEARQPVHMWTISVELLRVAFAPVPYDPGFSVMCALLIWIVFGLVDILALGLASPAWTFPPLLLPYLLPCLIIFAEIDPALLIGPGIGYVIVLSAATGGRKAGNRAVLATATTALALFGGIALALPVPPDSAAAQDSENGPIRLTDPSLDLVRTLRQNSNQVLLRYQTSDGGGEYLRLTALPVFDRQGFHPSPSPLTELDRANQPPARAAAQLTTEIEVRGLASQYLPMPWFPVTADVSERDWKRQPDTQSIVSRDGPRTRGIRYSAVSMQVPSESAKLNGLRAGDPGDDSLTATLELPVGLAERIPRLAQSLTEGRSSDGAKVQALADYLRSARFHYSTAGAAGTPMSTLDDFLFGSRTGYCVQFASSLAVLSRAIGVPSRVVVGFLPGKDVGDHWEVTGQNMHAWTELYFVETGWLKVDPTPSGGLTNPPPPEDSSSPSPSPSPTASPTPSESTASPSASPAAEQSPSSQASHTLPGWLGTGAAGLTGAAALLVGPSLIRRFRRRRRLAVVEPVAAVEAAWQEIRATALDHAQTWPAGTPREVAAQLGEGLPDADRQQLLGLAADLDRIHFDQDPAPAPELPRRTEQILVGIERTWPNTWLQRWWPKSLRPFSR